MRVLPGLILAFLFVGGCGADDEDKPGTGTVVDVDADADADADDCSELWFCRHPADLFFDDIAFSPEPIGCLPGR